MLALLSRQPGGPDTLALEELPDPRPGPGEVLIAVKACGVNYPDLLIIEDRYQFKPERPFAPGGEVSGIVEEVGEGRRGSEGRRPRHRTRASGAAWPRSWRSRPDAASRMPDAMPFDEAAAFVLTYGTSYHALKDRAAPRSAARHCSSWAPRAASASRRSSSARPWGRGSSRRPRPTRSSPWPRRMAPTTASSIRRCFDKPAPRARGPVQGGLRRNGADVIYDPVGGEYAEAALARDRLGRAASWWSASRPASPRSRSICRSSSPARIVGVFWGAFAERDRKANARNIASSSTSTRGRDPAGGLRACAPRACRRGHRGPRRSQGHGQDRRRHGRAA